MGWTTLDLAGDTVVGREVWAEFAEKIELLDAVEASTYSVPTLPAGREFADRGAAAVFGTYIPGTTLMYMPYYLRFRITLEWMHEPYDGTRYYWDSGEEEMVALTWLEVCALAGITDDDHWLRTPFWIYNGITTYEVGDIVWAHRAWHEYSTHSYLWCRFRCIQGHEGHASKKPGDHGGGGDAYWERVREFCTIDWLNDFRDVIDYIKENAWIRKMNTKAGTSATPEYTTGVAEYTGPPYEVLPIETSWVDAKASATGAANGAWGDSDPWTDGGNYRPMMIARVVYNTGQDPDPRWIPPWHDNSPTYCEDQYVGVLRDCGFMIDTQSWHDDLKASGCKYKHHFNTESHWGGPWNGHVHASFINTGFMPTPILMEGNDIGTLEGEGGSEEERRVWVLNRYIGCEWSDFNWDDDEADMVYDDSDWSAFEPPKYYDLELDVWVITTVYAHDDLRQHGGVDYRCIDPHTATAVNEPGVGVDWEDFWEVTARYGWHDPADGDSDAFDSCDGDHGGWVSQYRWTCPKWTAIYIKPDYQDW